MAVLESIEKDLSDWVEREMRATEKQRADAVLSLFSSLPYDAQRKILRELVAEHDNLTSYEDVRAK